MRGRLALTINNLKDKTINLVYRNEVLMVLISIPF